MSSALSSRERSIACCQFASSPPRADSGRMVLPAAAAADPLTPSLLLRSTLSHTEAGSQEVWDEVGRVCVQVAGEHPQPRLLQEFTRVGFRFAINRLLAQLYTRCLPCHALEKAAESRRSSAAGCRGAAGPDSQPSPPAEQHTCSEGTCRAGEQGRTVHVCMLSRRWQVHMMAKVIGCRVTRNILQTGCPLLACGCHNSTCT